MTCALSLNALHAGYGAGDILRGVSFDAPPGSFVAVLGPNGVGKSTLLRAILGVITPSQGSITPNLARLSNAARAARLAYIPQRTTPGAGLTLHQFVSLGRYARPHAPHIVHEALERVCLHDLDHRAFLELSIGQQQLAALARALAQLAGDDAPPAQLLLADEPTSALDPRHAAAVLSILRSQCSAGRTVLAVMHDPTSALAVATHALLLHDDHSALFGPASQVVTRENLERLFGVGFESRRAWSTRLITT